MMVQDGGGRSEVKVDTHVRGISGTQNYMGVDIFVGYFQIAMQQILREILTRMNSWSTTVQEGTPKIV